MLKLLWLIVLDFAFSELYIKPHFISYKGRHMGLFNKLLSGQASSAQALSPQEAFAAVLLTAVAADGQISDEERDLFVSTSNRMKLLKDQTAAQFNSMMDKLFLILKREGSQALLEKAKSAVPSELRETAFALAADIVFADGSVEPEEMAIVEAIQQGMGIADEQALKIVEVLQIKNRG